MLLLESFNRTGICRNLIIQKQFLKRFTYQTLMHFYTNKSIMYDILISQRANLKKSVLLRETICALRVPLKTCIRTTSVLKICSVLVRPGTFIIQSQNLALALRLKGMSYSLEQALCYTHNLVRSILVK